MFAQEPASSPQATGGFLRIRIDFGYDGAPFSGWAKQPGLKTVQQSLETALELIIRRPVPLVVAGRTDAGVHARRQSVHCDLSEAEWGTINRRGALPPEAALQRRLQGALSRVLGEEAGAIMVHTCQKVSAEFDARFSALWRRYRYTIADTSARWDPLLRHVTWWYRDSLDTDLMNTGAEALLGLHDFMAFCKPRPGASTIRELQEFTFSRTEQGLVQVEVQADAFCHHMVRSLVGAAVHVGSGKQGPEWLGDRLQARQRDGQSLLAPAHALVLEEVGYPSAEELGRRAELTRARRNAEEC